MLKFLKEKEAELVEVGLLMPSFLAYVMPHKVYDLLRQEFYSGPNEEIPIFYSGGHPLQKN